MIDKISDIAYDPIGDAEEEERQERIAEQRKKLNKETKNNENDK